MVDHSLRPAASPPRPLVGSVVQAISVLRHLGRSDRPEGVTAIATRLGISPSSCFNILKTLAAEDLAVFDMETRAYSLGPGVIELARAALGRDPVTKAARPAMDRIARNHNATVALWRLGGDERLTLIALAENDAATRIHMVVGQRQPAEAGATGRAVLAARGASESQIARACSAVRWQQAPATEEHVAQVIEARARGWALDIDHIFIGVTTAAATIQDREDRVQFVLSASIFSGRETPQRIDALGAAVANAARAIDRTVYGGA